ncbi:hypothetical protein [Kocuria sp.]|nr:hypothetical protein [Kocuria sp.]MDO5618935.1 hypothetical protein [Kocuria sp.]
MPHDTSRTVPGARRVTAPEDAEYRSCALRNSSQSLRFDLPVVMTR